MNPNPEHVGRLATAVDGAVVDADIDVAMSVAFAFRLRTVREAARGVADVERGTRDWRTVASGHGIARREVELMAAAFETEQRAVARRVDEGGT
jgi:serine/threonine-protein kinase HipA